MMLDVFRSHRDRDMDSQQQPSTDAQDQPKVKRRLGRGLNALLGSGAEPAAEKPAIRLHSPCLLYTSPSPRDS